MATAAQIHIDTVVTVTDTAQTLATIMSQDYDFTNGVHLYNYDEGTIIVHGRNDTIGLTDTETGQVLYFTFQYKDEDSVLKDYLRASELYLISDQASSKLRVRFIGRER